MTREINDFGDLEQNIGHTGWVYSEYELDPKLKQFFCGGVLIVVISNRNIRFFTDLQNYLYEETDFTHCVSGSCGEYVRPRLPDESYRSGICRRKPVN